MAKSKYTPALAQVREQALLSRLFEGNGGYSGKVRCTVCGSTGYPGGSWMDVHIEGHSECPDCGKVKATRVMRKHRSHWSHP